LLEARYKWGYTPEAIAQMKDEELLMALGRKRGALLPGGRLNAQKAAESLLTDFRAGTLGRITLETPDEFARWLAAGQASEASLAAERKQRAERRGGARRDA